MGAGDLRDEGVLRLRANPDAEVWWFANLPEREEPAKDRPRESGDPLRTHLEGMLADDAGPALQLIRATTDGYHLEPLTGTMPAPSGADAEGAIDQ